MRKYSIISLVSFVVVLNSCSDRPKNVLSDSEMVRTMADLEIAQSYIQNKGYTNGGSDNKDRILEYVLVKNKVSREDFDSTISWYGRHIDKYDELYQKVDKELARRESRISGNATEVLSNDLWPYSRHLVISSKSNTDNLSFSLPPKDVVKGDRIIWKFNLSMPVDGNAILGVRYLDGNVAYISIHPNHNTNELSLQTDTSRNIREIFGNLRLRDNIGIIGVDSIILNSIPFDSTEYYRINSMKLYGKPQNKRISPIVPDSLASKD